MYSLKVLKSLQHPDGRYFEPGHDCHALDAFEVSELIVDYPEYFEGADEITLDFMKDTAKLQHLASAVKRKQAESGVVGSLKVRKQ